MPFNEEEDYELSKVAEEGLITSPTDQERLYLCSIWHPFLTVHKGKGTSNHKSESRVSFWDSGKAAGIDLMTDLRYLN
jgi:hypothetical protein